MSFSSPSGSGSSCSRWPTPSPAIVSKEVVVVLDYWLAGIVTVGILVYLVYALLTPEKF
jgi:K+-transporting ATPase KdpF subunit